MNLESPDLHPDERLRIEDALRFQLWQIAGAGPEIFSSFNSTTDLAVWLRKLAHEATDNPGVSFEAAWSYLCYHAGLCLDKDGNLQQKLNWNNWAIDWAKELPKQ